MDPLVVGGLILAACALKGGNKNGGKHGGHHSSRKTTHLRGNTIIVTLEFSS